jgi:hypothetical protein
MNPYEGFEPSGLVVVLVLGTFALVAFWRWASNKQMDRSVAKESKQTRIEMNRKLARMEIEFCESKIAEARAELAELPANAVDSVAYQGLIADIRECELRIEKARPDLA